MAECLITVGQMTNLCMCIIVVRQHPESLDYDLATLQAEKATDEAAVHDTDLPLNTSLKDFFKVK